MNEDTNPENQTPLDQPETPAFPPETATPEVPTTEPAATPEVTPSEISSELSELLGATDTAPETESVEATEVPEFSDTTQNVEPDFTPVTPTPPKKVAKGLLFWYLSPSCCLLQRLL